jgi:ubiquinone/menaquinone biosynthesis C-methylase UbiE
MENYFNEIYEYYNHSRIPDEKGYGKRFFEGVKQNRSWLHHLVNEMQFHFEGRQALEVACGMGRWTYQVSKFAKHITATDISENLLENAKGMEIPKDRVEFVQCDAFCIDEIVGDFDGGFHMNFLNHLPLDTIPEFLEKFHGVLGKGKTVFCGSQRGRGNKQNPFYEKRDTGDMFSIRKHDDGKEIHVIDTIFSEELLRGLLAGRAKDLNMTFCKWWWWASYTIV